MSKFIELTDYDASIHREILDALTREDNAVVEICEDRAIEEMRCYLSKRYDCDRIFTETGDRRKTSHFGTLRTRLVPHETAICCLF